MLYKWVCLGVALWFAIISTILLFIYIPRIESIKRLEARLERKDAKIRKLSDDLFLERMDHIDDTASFAVQMAEQVARTNQETSRANKMAETAEKFRQKVEGAEV